MNWTSKSLTALLLFILLFPAGTCASDWWILGTVKGEKINEKAIAVHLVNIDDPAGTVVSQTTTNKAGQYAFSDPGEGLPPKAYKIVLKITTDFSIDVSLEDAEPQGWKPTVIPPVTVYW